MHRSLVSARNDIRVYRDQPSLRKGNNWVIQLAYALDASRYVLTLYSPSYWDSNICLNELSAAYTRQASSGSTVLYPIFYRDTKIPNFFQVLHFTDCREADDDKLSAACLELCQALD